MKQIILASVGAVALAMSLAGCDSETPSSSTTAGGPPIQEGLRTPPPPKAPPGPGGGGSMSETKDVDPNLVKPPKGN